MLKNAALERRRWLVAMDGLNYAKKKRLTEILQSRKKRAMMDPEGHVVCVAKSVVCDTFPG